MFSSPDDLPKKRPAQIYKPSNPDTLAYLDFSVSTTGMLAGVKVRNNLSSVQLAGHRVMLNFHSYVYRALVGPGIETRREVYAYVCVLVKL